MQYITRLFFIGIIVLTLWYYVNSFQLAVYSHSRRQSTLQMHSKQTKWFPIPLTKQMNRISKTSLFVSSYTIQPKKWANELKLKWKQVYDLTIGALVVYITKLFNALLKRFPKKPSQLDSSTNKLLVENAATIPTTTLSQPAIVASSNESETSNLTEDEIIAAREIVVRKLKEIEKLQQETASLVALETTTATSSISTNLSNVSEVITEDISLESTLILENVIEDNTTSNEKDEDGKDKGVVVEATTEQIEDELEESKDLESSTIISNTNEIASNEGISNHDDDDDDDDDDDIVEDLPIMTFIEEVESDIISESSEEVPKTLYSQTNTFSDNIISTEELIKTFPPILSPETKDPLYMKFETGPVDKFAISIENFNILSSRDKQDNEYDFDDELNNIFNSVSFSNMEMKSFDSSIKVFKEYLSLEKMNLLKDKIKAAGISGTISYIISEMLFWIANIPFILQVSNHNDITSSNQQSEVLILGLSIITIARFAIPLRLAFALLITPWVNENITKVYFHKQENEKDV